MHDFHNTAEIHVYDERETTLIGKNMSNRFETENARLLTTTNIIQCSCGIHAILTSLQNC